MGNGYPNLNPEKALIWRITHIRNMPWVFRNGLHCRNSATQDPNYFNIGNLELIDRRTHREVPIPPGGTLSDYIPFCFTPFSPMMLNIHTGRGVVQRNNDEICIMVSSLHKLHELGHSFVFTDRHAYTSLAEFFSDLADLKAIDWPLLQARDFKRDPNDPIKVERYQAEALVHSEIPIQALLGVVCHSPVIQSGLQDQAAALGLDISIHSFPGWYF